MPESGSGQKLTSSDAAPKRGTWLDLLPPGIPEPPADTLLTRAQLLERVGHRANENDLRYWEYIGVLPRPVRRWHDGATRALYPHWIGLGILQLRSLQKNGLPLDEIGPRVRSSMSLMAAMGSDLDDEAAFDTWFTFDQKHANARALNPITDLALRELGRARAELTGVPTSCVEVRVIGVDGRKTTYTIDLSENDSQTPSTRSP